MKRIVLAGGTGNIGKLLSKVLTDSNYEVIILSRSDQDSSSSLIKYVKWDGENQGAWVQELEKADAVINLSGKSIQCRFTEENKKALLKSRIDPTNALGEAIKSLTNPPRLWINFSGISLFEGLEGLYDEDSTVYADTFLANLTKKWEHVFFSAETSSTTKVCLRLSPVLSTEFGMFKELYPLAKLGLGGTVGDGMQKISWIHESDLVSLVSWIINHESPGKVYHACAPKPESNKEFMQNLRTAVNMPIGMPLPKVFAKIGAYFKGVESDMLLLSNSVASKRTIQEGFIHKYPNTHSAFKDLIK